jgi:alpha-glucosidase
LRDQLELVVRQPCHVDRGYLTTAEYLERHVRFGQQSAQVPDPLWQLAEVDLAHMGRGHNSPGTVRDGKAGELQCLALVSRSVVDARQEMEVKLGSHPTLSTRRVQPSYDTQPWWQREVIYQIYPRSFADSDGDGVGDLRGIIDRLDYIARLGVGAIWLSPFYPSPMADFGYDVADYADVDPLFGDLTDFDELLARAHHRGIKVIIDWVPNHTSDQHPWFLESRSGRDSPRRDWYVWRDPAPDGGPPNNWESSFKAAGPAWTLDEDSGQYYLHKFLPAQPDLNWENPAVQEAMHDVLRFWLDRGVDGFRIDVVYGIAKDPELADNEPERRHDEDWPTIHERLRGLRRVIDEYEERMLVGEVYLDKLDRVAAYINSGHELQLAHNFVFVHLPWDARAVRSSVEEFGRLLRPGAWPTWFLENHDHSRVPSRYAASPEQGARRGRVAAMLVCTLRGTAFLYQGQELGLPDAEIPPERIVDVDGRDPERAPIPWRRPSGAGAGAGFTSGDPWLPPVATAEELCVEVQEADDGSTLAFVRRLIDFRSRTPALRSGAQRSLDASPGGYCFTRETDDERVLVALNFTSGALPLGMEHELGEQPAKLELSTDPGRAGGQLDPRELVLEPDEGVILRLAR